MLYRMLICKLLLLLGVPSVAQIDSGTIIVKGWVVTNENLPIEIGNVMLLNPVDSTIINGDFFENGQFSLLIDTTGDFDLRVTALGHRDYSKRVKVVNDITLSSIVLEYSKELTVEIIGREDLIVQDGQTLTVNVANSPLQESGSATDVLRNIPKVYFDRNGTPAIFGRTSTIIYLNGKRLFTTQVLENLSSQDIKSIRLLENPPAKYDSEGGAVIEIITKKKTLDGYKLGLPVLNLNKREEEITKNQAKSTAQGSR